MSLPDKSTKHIPRPQAPVGAIKDGKVKVFDGESQTEKWRMGTTGMSRDWDGDPISTNYNARDMKQRKVRRTHMGYKKKTHKPKMDEVKVSEE